MGEAFITRREKFGQLSVENLKDHFNSEKYIFEGFDFKNTSYFFRLCYMESSPNTRYIYDFIVERGGSIIEISSVASGASLSGWTDSKVFLESITIDVEQGTLYPDRKYATFIYKFSECACVILN